jgi:hypothetical protein
MPLDEPLAIAPVSGLHERETALLDRGERRHPQYRSLSLRMKRSTPPMPSGARTNAGLDAMPRKRSSAWKYALSYWLP